MTADLSGVEAKIAWARWHLAELTKSIGDTLDAHPYRFDGRLDAETGHYVVSVHDLPVMDPTWSLRVGDIVHNLRSALDHLAWQLVILDGGQPNRTTQFPIRKSPLKNGSRTPTQLQPTVNKPEILDALEAVQPYLDQEGKPANYANNLLWCLHRLDITDKHRLLLVVRAALKLPGMTWGGYGDQPEPAWRLNQAPLDEGDVVAWFDFGGHEPPSSWGAYPDISIVLYEVDVRDLTHRSVVQLLEAIAGWVEDYIVNYTFRPLFRD